MIKRLLIAITIVLSKLSNVTNATEFGPERAQFIINYQSLEQIHLYVLTALTYILGAYPRGGVSKIQILATTGTDSVW